MAKKSSSPVNPPGADRTGRSHGFGGFRQSLADQGRLEKVIVPERETRVPQRHVPDRMNLLWIMTDHLRADVLGFAGYPGMKTPNIDRLADGGFVFENAYCCEPVCMPSRATLITGLYPFAHGVVQNGYDMRPETVTMPPLLRQAGYRTANIMKTHFGRKGGDVYEYCQSIDEPFGIYKPSKAAFKPSNFPDAVFLRHTPVDNSDAVLYGSYPAPVETSGTYHTATEAMKWLYWHDDPRPFFLCASFNEPHPPLLPPPPFNAMYKPADVWPELHERWKESLDSKCQTVRDWRGYHGDDSVTEEDFTRYTMAFMGMVSHLDAQIGRILDYLEQIDMAERTIVILTSDHGNMLGEHGLVHKGPYCYEGVSKVPMVIRWPGVARPGGRSRTLFSGVDFVPTVMDMLGVAPPAGLPGVSHATELRGGGPAENPYLFIQWDDYIYAVRDARWKLIWYDADSKGELYDLAGDPYEKVNRIDDPQCAAVRDDLLNRLRAHRDRYARPEDHPRRKPS